MDLREKKQLIKQLKNGAFIRSHVTLTGADGFRMLDKKFNPICNILKATLAQLVKKQIVEKNGNVYTHNKNFKNESF